MAKRIKRTPRDFTFDLFDKPCFETLIALKPGASTIAELRGRLGSVTDAHAIGVRLAALERVGLVARFRSGPSDTWFLKREGLSRAIGCLSELLSEAPQSTEAYEFRARFSKVFKAYKIYPTPARLRILESLTVSCASAAELLERLTPKVTRKSINSALWAFEAAGIVSSKSVGPPPGPRAVITVVLSITPLGLEMLRAIHGDNWPAPRREKVEACQGSINALISVTYGAGADLSAAS
jgi:hypothetical protein